MISPLYYQHIPIGTGTGRYLRYICTLTNKVNIYWLYSVDPYLSY